MESIRRIVSIVRCPARGGSCVEVTNVCISENRKENSACPCLKSFDETQLTCSYPKYVSNKDGTVAEGRRKKVIPSGIEKEKIFSVHVPFSGGEWESSQANLTNDGDELKVKSGVNYAK